MDKIFGGVDPGFLEQKDPLLPKRTLSDFWPIDTPSKSAVAHIDCFACTSAPDRGSLFSCDELIVTIAGRPIWKTENSSPKIDSNGLAIRIAEGFKKKGREILQDIHGNFAVGILEPRQQKALIAVDRTGISPLAFHVAGKRFIFGSTIKSILKYPGIAPKIDPQSVFAYLYFHMIPSPATIYEGVSKLLPGEYVEFDNGSLLRGIYWQPNYQEEAMNERDLASELRTLLDAAVRRSMANHGSIGTFLSGGLDSSTVTGIFRKLSARKTDAFGIGFQAGGYDEMHYARASAKHFDVNLHEYYVTPDDVADSLPRIAGTYDEPFGNASAVPAYYCAKLAREHGKSCLLAGDGGDELFAGNERYAKQKLFDIYRKVPAPCRSVIEPIAYRIPFLAKLKSYIEQAKLPMPDRLETYNFLYRTPVEEVLHDDFLAKIDPKGPISNLRKTYESARTESLIKHMLDLDMKFTLADNDLRKVNYMCDLAKIDVAYPLLDDPIVELAARVPSSLLMRRFELRSFYRGALSDFLAPETLKKSKHGFGLPFGLWLKNHVRLNELADESLKNIRKREILSPAYLDTLISKHQTGHAAYYGVMIWVLTALDLWFQAQDEARKAP